MHKSKEDSESLSYSNMKILFWDVETSPIVAAVWGLYNQDIHHDSIIDDWFMISAAWKWHGKKRTHAVSVLDDKKRFAKNHKNDYIVIKTLHGVLSQADVLVAHNGDAFDLKKFNARALCHGLEPIPPVFTVDTLKEARKTFKFTSNRLDYLGQHFGVGKKVDTPKGLWMGALRGSKKAIKTMVTYNRGDISLLEDVFTKLRPYIKKRPNQNLFQPNGDSPICANCGSKALIRSGYLYTKVVVKQRYKCNNCGSWSSSGHSIKRAEIR